MLVELAFLGIVGKVLYDVMSSTEDNEVCDYNELKHIKGDGVLCTQNVRLSVKQSNEHILMVAPSAAGKSKRFLSHNIKQLDNCSIICNNPNGELRKFNKHKKQYIFSPFDENTVGYNPLDNCMTEFDVEKIASIIIQSGMAEDSSMGKQQEWVDMAKPLITSYFLFNWYTKRYTFFDMIKNLMIKPLVPTVNKEGEVVSKELSLAEELMDSGVESAIIKFKSFMKGFEAKGTIASIYAVMNSCLRIFTDSSVKKILSKPNFDINILRKEESILFIEIPERHTDYFKPLTNVLINQLLDRLFDSDGLQIYFLMDEFGNTKIENVSTVLSTARKKRISLVCTIQSLNQLKDVYGNKSDTVRELFKTLLVTGGLRDSTEYISNIVGECIRLNNDKKEVKDKLLRPDEIRRLNDDEMLIICSNKRVVKDNMMEVLI